VPKKKSRKAAVEVSHTVRRLYLAPSRRIPDTDEPRKAPAPARQQRAETAAMAQSSDDEAPAKKKKLEASDKLVKDKAPLAETSKGNKATASKDKSQEVTKAKGKGAGAGAGADAAGEADEIDDASGVGVPEKKKKRKLLGVQAAFKWDPILNVSTIPDIQPMTRSSRLDVRRTLPLLMVRRAETVSSH
jgi:hypothetical protein